MPHLLGAQRRHAVRHLTTLEELGDEYEAGDEVETLTHFDSDWEQIQQTRMWPRQQANVIGE